MNAIKFKFPELTKAHMFMSKDEYAKAQIDSKFPDKDAPVVLNKSFVNYFNKHKTRPLELIQTDNEDLVEYELKNLNV